MKALLGKFTHFIGTWTARRKPSAPVPHRLPDADPVDGGVVRQNEEHPSPAYMALKLRFRDIGRLGAIAETLGRDFLTAMPEGAWKSRLGQIAYLHRRLHEDLVAPDIARLIERARDHEAAHEHDWDEWDRANLREMEIMYRRHCHIGGDLVERHARLAYEGRRRHRDCLRAGDWPDARSFLSQTIDMQRQIAEAVCRATGRNDQYQVLLEEHMPGIDQNAMNDWFTVTESRLKKILPAIVEKQAAEDAPLPIHDFYPAKAQMWLNHALLESVGFDFTRGGLYETGHNPVEGGTPDDTRLVIKNVDTTNFLDSLKSALHEGGHGIYIQGLPRQTWRYQPVAQDMGAAVQESQALLVEMIIGRTRSFFNFLAPRVEGLFHGLHNPVLSAENLHRLKTRVKATPIRRTADEVTYFFHILHRYRLEKDLIEGKLKLVDLPEAWDAGMQNVLGIRPSNHAEGCLQDVHWFVGKFGYFPSYAVGHMLAAQQYEALRRDLPDVEGDIGRGDFSGVTKWLRNNIHGRGRLLPFAGLTKSATGFAPGPDALLRHLERRYLKAAA